MMWHGFMTVKMNGRSASEFSISHQLMRTPPRLSSPRGHLHWPWSVRLRATRTAGKLRRRRRRRRPAGISLHRCWRSDHSCRRRRRKASTSESVLTALAALGQAVEAMVGRNVENGERDELQANDAYDGEGTEGDRPAVAQYWRLAEQPGVSEAGIGPYARPHAPLPPLHTLSHMLARSCSGLFSPTST